MSKPGAFSGTAFFSDRFFILAGIIWSFFVFSHYFSPASVLDFSFLNQLKRDWPQVNGSTLEATLAGRGPGFLWDFAIGLTLWAWGKRLGLWIGLPELPLALKTAFQAALGIVFFNSLWFGLGLSGLWFKSLFLILSLLFMGPAFWFLIKDLRRAWKRSRSDFKLPARAWVIAPVILAGFLYLLALAQSLVPEIYFDGLVYHLSVLQFWWDRHGILDFATNFHSYYPFGAELYFLNGFWPSGAGEDAKLMNVFSLGLTVLAAAGWVAEESGAAFGWLTGASLLFLPWVSTTVWTTQNEVVLAFFLLLFFYAMRRWAREDNEGQRFVWVILAGLTGGAALSVKYTAAPAFLAAGAALFIENPKSFGRERWKEWLLGAALLSGALGPWLLKNFFYTGNLLYPYLAQWIGGRSLSPERFQELLTNHESVFGVGGAPFWKWPYELIVHHVDKTMGPLLFSFLPFLAAGFASWKKERYLLTLVSLYLAGGFLISYQTRLMIPEMVLFLVGTGCFLGKFKKPGLSRIWAVILLVFGLTTFLSLVRLSANYTQSQKIWFGDKTREDFLKTSPQTVSFYSLARACDPLAPGDRLLVVGDARGLYYPRAYFANSVFDDPQLVKIAREAPNAEGIRRRLQQLGVDDLVIPGDEEMRLCRLYPKDYALTTAQWKNLDDFIQRGTDLVYLKGPQAIYHLRSGLSARPQRIPDLLLLLPNSKARL